MSQRIAFFTFGVMREPVDHQQLKGFVDRIASVYAAADGSAGFFARSVRDVETWEHSWGPVIAPACTPPGVPLNQLAMTLSLWQDLESVMAYSYRGAHHEALTRRSEWFERGPWPGYVAWWVPEAHRPKWDEATARLDHLHVHGPDASAFTFRKAFDAAGQPMMLKRKGSAA